MRALLTVFMLLVASADAREVDLELVLAVDVSGSMDADEKIVQRQGFVDAMRHPDVIAAIENGLIGAIAVTYVEWAGDGLAEIIVPWRVVDGTASATAFSAELAGAHQAFIRGTSISTAIDYSARLFDNNGLDSLRRVIDISGDGPNNRGRPVTRARDDAVATGITINGLPLIIRPGGYFYTGREVDLSVYYRDCVIGGFGAFVIPVTSIEEYPAAIRRKLVLEIAGFSPWYGAQAMPAQSESGTTDCLVGERLRRIWDDP